MRTIKLKIITPNKIALEREVYSVSAPTESGEITILPGHMGLFTLLIEGIVKIKTTTSEDFLSIGGGYLQTNGDQVNVLVSSAYGQTEIDQKQTEDAVNEAKKIINQTKDVNERAEATAILRRSIVDLKLLKKRKRPV